MNSNPKEVFVDCVYKPRHFDIDGLRGISDATLEIHFALYEGYVKETNLLNEMIAELVNRAPVDAEKLATFPELKRRLAFEFNGMILHEYYFDNLRRNGGGEPARNSAFRSVAEASFGSFDAWRRDFTNVGRMRGVGWAITYLNAATGRLANQWVTLHENGHLAGLKPVLVMDAWEHAFLLDYTPAERPRYVEAFFSNVDWTAVESRMWPRAVPSSAAARTR